MSGPTKNAMSPGERAERRERWALFAGLIVVIGLLVESGPELARAIITLTWPPRVDIGNVVVTLGVAGEVLFSWGALLAARKAEIAAEERIAETVERSRHAELAVAEANLALENERAERAKLNLKVNRRSVSRNLHPHEAESLSAKLRTHWGQTFTLRASRTRAEANDLKPAETNFEQSFFVMQLRGILTASGWESETIANLPDFRCAKGLTIFCRNGKETSQPVSDLARALAEMDIGCTVSVQPEDFPVPIIICVGLL